MKGSSCGIHKLRVWSLALSILVIVACGGGGSEPDTEVDPPPVDSPPVVHGVVLGHDGSSRVAPAAATFASGDTVLIRIYASSGTSLTWMGLLTAVGSTLLRDSVAVPDHLATPGELVLEYEIRVPAAFSGTIDLTGFARDTHGLLTESPLQNTPVSIWSDVMASEGSSVALPAPVMDVAFDPEGERAYIALAGRAEVAVLELGSMTFQTPITLPVPPSALDVSPSGNSLVVALPGVQQVPVTHAIGILDLANPIQLDKILLPREPAEFDRGPSAVRVTSRDEAFVIMSINGSGAAGYLFAYDLAARTFRGGSALGLPDRIDNHTKLARSADGTRILFYYGGSCCPTTAQLYNAVENNLLPVQNGVEWYGAPLSMTSVGNRTLIKASLYGSGLQPVQEYHPPGEGQGSALSPDGAYAYFRVGGGFLRTRLADGVSLQRFVLPETPVRLVRVPGPVERVLAFSSAAAYMTAIQSSAAVTAPAFTVLTSALGFYRSLPR